MNDRFNQDYPHRNEQPERLFKLSEIISASSNEFEDPVNPKKTRLVKTKKDQDQKERIVKFQGGPDSEQVKKVMGKSSNQIIYVEADSSPVAVILPREFNPEQILIIKRLFTSRYPVYVEPNQDQTIEGDSIPLELVDQEEGMSSIIMSWFEDNWHILG